MSGRRYSKTCQTFRSFCPDGEAGARRPAGLTRRPRDLAVLIEP